MGLAVRSYDCFTRLDDRGRGRWDRAAPGEAPQSGTMKGGSVTVPYPLLALFLALAPLSGFVAALTRADRRRWRSARGLCPA